MFFINRCKEWVKNAGNETLLNVPSSHLHSKYFLCADHFTTDQFFNADRTALLQTAIPTIFQHNQPLDDTQMESFPVLTIEQQCRSKKLIKKNFKQPV